MKLFQAGAHVSLSHLQADHNAVNKFWITPRTTIIPG